LAGTIKHAQLAAIAHNRQLVARLRAKSKLPGKQKKVLSTVGLAESFIYVDSYTQRLEQSELEINALKD